MIKQILSMGIYLLAGSNIVLAHEPGEIALGSAFFQLLFMCILIVFIALVCAAGVEKLPRSLRTLGYGIVGLSALAGIGYFVYHYYIH